MYLHTSITVLGCQYFTGLVKVQGLQTSQTSTCINHPPPTTMVRDAKIVSVCFFFTFTFVCDVILMLKNCCHKKHTDMFLLKDNLHTIQHYCKMNQKLSLELSAYLHCWM